jgi:hypothetical protein
LKRLDFQPKRVFVTVKAYPNPSYNYGETVCCAGVDMDTGYWVRLYPIPYRDLENDQRFKKYSLIEANCAKATDDLRPESFRIQPDSIKIIEQIDTRRDGWDRRKAIIQRLTVKSMCTVLQEEELQKTSLALIKPDDVSFLIKKRPITDSAKREKAYAHPGLFDKPKEPVEEIPFQFYYQFKCISEPDCAGHTLSIIDWEIHQSYRKWRGIYRDERELLSKIKQRWMMMVDSTTREVFFYVGNLHRFQDIFTVLGVFYPPIKRG